MTAPLDPANFVQSPRSSQEIAAEILDKTATINGTETHSFGDVARALYFASNPLNNAKMEQLQKGCRGNVQKLEAALKSIKQSGKLDISHRPAIESALSTLAAAATWVDFVASGTYPTEEMAQYHQSTVGAIAAAKIAATASEETTEYRMTAQHLNTTLPSLMQELAESLNLSLKPNSFKLS